MGDTDHTACSINPATGLPMIGGCGGVDVMGNPYGTNMNSNHLGDINSPVGLTDDSLSTSSSFSDDSWSTSSSFSDDSWSSTSSFSDDS